MSKGSRRRRVATLAAERLEERKLLSSYGPDVYFGSGGVATASYGMTASAATAVAALPDGEFYAACVVNNQHGVAKFDFNGNIEPAFGTGGVTRTQYSSNGTNAPSMVLQADGKIVVAGSDQHRIFLTRFNTDGSIDPTFGSLTENFSYGDFVAQVAIQPDGKILTVGYSNNGNHYRAEMVRFNTDGSLDSSFGAGGDVISDLGPLIGGNVEASSEIANVVVMGDGTLMVGGYANSQPMLAHYLANGTLDSSFADHGVAHQQLFGGESFNGASDIVAAPGGGFYTVVESWQTRGLGLVKWMAGGQVDTKWGNQGKFDLGNTDPGTDGKAKVQPDGTIVVLGKYYSPNGFSLDTISASGTARLYSTFQGGANDQGGCGLALQADGRVLVASAFPTLQLPPVYDSQVYRFRTMPNRSEGFSLEGNILTVLGESAPSTVVLSNDGSGNYSVTLDGSTLLLPASAVGHIDVRLLGSGNAVYCGADVPLNVVDMSQGGGNTATVNGAMLYEIGTGTGGDTVNFPVPVGTGNGRSIVTGNSNDQVDFTGTDGGEDFNVASMAVTSPGRHVTLLGVSRVQISTGNGNDTVEINAPSGPAVTVQAGDGNDIFTTTGGGTATTPDVIEAGAGHDVLLATTAASQVLNYVANVLGTSDVKLNLAGAFNQTATMTSHGISTSDGFSLEVGSVLNLASLELDDSQSRSVTLDFSQGANPLPYLLRLNGTFVLNSLAGGNPLAGREIDIGTSKVLITNYSGALIEPYLKNAYNGGKWNGTSASGVITSSAAAGDLSGKTSIGWAEGGDGTGVNTTPSSVLLKYTLVGDVNLDGAVNITDVNALVPNYNSSGGWTRGDFNYDGLVNITDVNALVPNFNTSLGSPVAQAGVVAAVGSSSTSGSSSEVAAAAAYSGGMNVVDGDLFSKKELKRGKNRHVGRE